MRCWSTSPLKIGFSLREKKTELATAYRRRDIEALPIRAAQREAIKKLEPFKPYHITDDLFREAEKASGQRRPGVKRRRQDD
jgi:hypothetical protein